jgi:PIN domain nuclease of toxin-antitoxin system
MSVDLLLDTHALIWLAVGDPRASALVKVVDDPACTVSVSTASWLEIAIKSSLGKLEPGVAATRRSMQRLPVLDLAISANHAEALEALPRHHGDPFDRILIAQALAEDMMIATVDPAFAAYEGLSLLWP